MAGVTGPDVRTVGDSTGDIQANIQLDHDPLFSIPAAAE